MLDVSKNLCFHIKETAKSDAGLYILNEKCEDKYYSYNEVYKKALHRLKTLNDKGINKGDELLIATDDILEFLISFWGCILGGIIAIPLKLGLTDEDILRLSTLSKMLDNPYLITEHNKVNLIRDYIDKSNKKNLDYLINEKTLIVEEIEDSEEEGKVCDMPLDSIALIQFSSGSTGVPKGVIITHRNLVSSTKDIAKASSLNESDKFLSWLPLTHNMGLLGLHTVPFLNKITQVLIPPIVYMKNPQIWLDAVSKYRITSTSSPNFGFRLFVNNYEKMNSEHWDLSCLRRIYNGAEPVSMELCRQFYGKLKQNGLKFSAIYPVYGLAEATLAAAFPKPFTDPEGIIVDRRKLNINDEVVVLKDINDKNAIEFAVVGYNIENCKIRICDEDNNELPEGRVGLVNIKGINVSSGYYKSSLKIAGEDGFYNTGDLGFIVDGKLSISGRFKEIIIVNGQNYYPFDIERVCSLVPEVVEGTVAACGSYNKNTNKEDLIIFIKTELEDEAYEKMCNEIRKQLLDKLLISADQIIKVSDIPKTASSKVARFRLVQMYEDGCFADQIKNNEIHKTFNVEENQLSQVEKAIIKIFKEELNVADIGLEDNLFSLELNSITIVKLVGELEKLYPNKITIADMYKFQTVKEIADYIEAKDILTLKGCRLKEDFLSKNNSVINEKLVISEDVIDTFKEAVVEKGYSIEEILIGVYLFVFSKLNEEVNFSVEIMQDKNTLKDVALDLKDARDLYEIIDLYNERLLQAPSFKSSNIGKLKNNIKDASMLLIYPYEEEIRSSLEFNEFAISLGIAKSKDEYSLYFTNNSDVKEEVIKVLPKYITNVFQQIKVLLED